MPIHHIPKPVTDWEKKALEKLMSETRPVCLYEDLKHKTVFSMPWHPTTPKRVPREG